MSNLENLTVEKISAQIKEIEAGREKFVKEAERQIAVIDGQLATLRWMLEDAPVAVQAGKPTEDAAEDEQDQKDERQLRREKVRLVQKMKV